jgi:diadenosine tetraphosphate (Ap4A) HIT family hydrolase
MKILALCIVAIVCLSQSVYAAYTPCPFCTPRIIETQGVFETKHLRVLIDFAPVVKGHLLVIPKRHISKAHEMTKEEWTELSEVIPKVVKVFQKKFNADQYLIIEKNGPLSGQTVPHVHFHVIPIPSEEMSEVAKIALFTKIFNITPSKMKTEEINQEVKTLRDSFNSK